MIIVIHHDKKRITLDNGNSIQTFAFTEIKQWDDGDMTVIYSGLKIMHIPNNYGIIIYADNIAEADNVIRE
jgi:hypothetical protein